MPMQAIRGRSLGRLRATELTRKNVRGRHAQGGQIGRCFQELTSIMFSRAIHRRNSCCMERWKGRGRSKPGACRHDNHHSWRWSRLFIATAAVSPMQFGIDVVSQAMHRTIAEDHIERRGMSAAKSRVQSRSYAPTVSAWERNSPGDWELVHRGKPRFESDYRRSGFGPNPYPSTNIGRPSRPFRSSTSPGRNTFRRRNTFCWFRR